MYDNETVSSFLLHLLSDVLCVDKKREQANNQLLMGKMGNTNDDKTTGPSL